jgi:hypothetical protein
VATAIRGLSRLVSHHHGLQPLAVMGIAGRDADDQGQSVRVRQDVHLGTRLAPVHGARTRVFVPLFGRSWAVSRTTRVTSMKPASSSRCKTTSCGRPQTSALDQIRNRRWAVDFETPKQGGNARQAQPPTST